MESDIVQRLREMAGPIRPNICTDAADEIERMRNDRTKASERFILAQLSLHDRLKAMQRERDALKAQADDEIERLRAGGCARDQKTTQYCAEAMRLQVEIERMREERDEARRELCDRLTECHFLDAPERDIEVRATAEARGWDCFKEASK